MKHSRTTAAAIATLLAAIAAPSFAGNYGEGDPRPVPFASATTRAAVTADAQQWLKTAPTQGYTDGNPQAQVATVSAKTRAEVAADTRLWQQSGLAALQRGEASVDFGRADYKKAVAEYTRLRASPAYGALVDQYSKQAATRTQNDLR